MDSFIKKIDLLLLFIYVDLYVYKYCTYYIHTVNINSQYCTYTIESLVLCDTCSAGKPVHIK